MSISPAALLVDGNGNGLAGQPGATLASTQSAIPILGSDYASSACLRLPKVDAAGTVYTANATANAQNATGANIVRVAAVTGSGSNASSSMIVNGSSTNVVFSWAPSTTTASYVISGINFVMSTPSFIFKGNSLGQVTSTSFNGILVQISSGGTYYTLATIRYNEDFLSFNGAIEVNQQGSTDYLRARLAFSQPIAANSGDGVRITIRDNLATNTAGGLLTAGTPNVYYLSAFVEGIRLTA